MFFEHELLILPPRDEEARQKLIEDIKETGEVADKEWLLKSINS